MACCHADFAALEGSDRGFTLGMPTFTFGPGVLAEAGDNAAELGLSRVALFTDRRLASGEHVAKVKASLAAAKVVTLLLRPSSIPVAANTPRPALWIVPLLSWLTSAPVETRRTVPAPASTASLSVSPPPERT